MKHVQLFIGGCVSAAHIFRTSPVILSLEQLHLYPRIHRQAKGTRDMKLIIA